MASRAILILSTAATRDEAARIAEALVADRLAACVQLSPIESWYRWQGEVEHAPETRLHIKTMAHLADAATQRLKALHSYAMPEVVVTALESGSADYLAWIEASVRSKAE
ncbi:MAG: divalent-cation tolerance protein CutA [Sphingomonas sp.]|nr:divalent-cation tolerance protein CutA [Sphingomonas sp.]